MKVIVYQYKIIIIIIIIIKIIITQIRKELLSKGSCNYLINS